MNVKISICILLIFTVFGCTAKKSIEIPEPDIDKEAVYKESLLWVFKPSVNIRNNASGSGEQLAQLKDGDSVIVLTNKNGWYQIKTLDGNTGWVRSDLLGPKELSVFPSAVRFIEKLKENDQAEIYFDKKLYHKRIYISFPDDMYTSRNDIENKTRNLLKQYQKDVYSGHVTARVLKPNSDEEYLTIEVEGTVNADPLLPVVPFGRIEKVDRNNPFEIKLSYSTPNHISDENLILTARELSSVFPISYRRIEITFKNAPYSLEEPCRLLFIEDKNGEVYKMGTCY